MTAIRLKLYSLQDLPKIMPPLYPPLAKNDPINFALLPLPFTSCGKPCPITRNLRLSFLLESKMQILQ